MPPPSKQATWPHILTAGVIGGFFAWLLSGTFPNYQTETISFTRELLKYLLGGGIAAMAGVYLLANTDTSKVPWALTFAAVCGLSWEPVIQSAQETINRAKDRDLAQMVKEALEAGKAVKASDPSEEDIKKLVDATLKAANGLPAARSFEVKDATEQVVLGNLTGLISLTEKEGDVAVWAGDALRKFGEDNGLGFKIQEEGNKWMVAYKPSVGSPPAF